jgi:type IV pilus assembly protein PilY1
MSWQRLKMAHILAMVAGMLAFSAGGLAWAAVPTLPNVPMATSSSIVVKPNILFTLDDSGSMAWDYLPDYVNTDSHCKRSTRCNNGMPPFQASAYNGMAYNPETDYKPPLNYDGSSKPSQNAANSVNWTNVPIDGYGVQSTGTIDLTTGYPDTLYCNSTYGCKQNGIDTNNPFFEDATGTGNPANYALPGSMTVFTSTIASTVNLYNGTLNGATIIQQTVFNGTLNNGSPSTTTITLTTPNPDVSISGTLVTLKYSSQSPATPAIASGDTITTSGSNCGSKYSASNATITVIGGNQLTYSSGGGGGSSKTNCNATVTHTTIPTPSAPSIKSAGGTVTVTLSAPPALTVGDLINVGNGSGTCDAGYKAANAAVTSVSGNSFTYMAQTGLGTASNTSCNITKSVITLPSSPGIGILGNVVTVVLNGHGLSTGDVVQVTGSSCGTAFTTSTTPGVVVTVLDANTFTYNSTAPSGTTGLACKIDHEILGTTTASFSTATTKKGNPYEYVIIPVEFCDSPYLTNCVASSVPTTVSGTNYNYPAPVRYCSSAAIAALKPGDVGAQISGTTVRCQGKYSNVTGLKYTYVRYGLFYRVDIVPTRATYGNEVLNGTINANGTNITFNNLTVIDRSRRADCAAEPNCTYDEEMTNFANYYAYYQTRMQMMKTSVGYAFNAPSMTGSTALYRLGFVTINANSWTSEYLAMGDIDYPVVAGGQKDKFYSKFYAINPGNSTPLREAVARAGRYYAGLHGLPGDSMSGDPMQYSCQQNFLLITTDGYWNGTTSNVVDLNGNQIGNVDNADSGMTKRIYGVYDGGVSGASTTLADTAEYYYQTDLRTSALGNCTSGSTGNALCSAASPDPLNDVPASKVDTDTGVTGGSMWQHMVTFSLGLADGLMLYQPDYATSSTGDFSKIKSGASGCPFSGSGTCNWPLPAADTQTALDDLWHGAVNGRGAYFNARDPSSLASGLSGALAGMQAQTGSASASSTSSPNVSKQDRAIFSSTYQTQYWDGEVVAQLLDPLTGNVPPSTFTPLPSITSISLSGTTVTVKLTSHGLISGDWVQVGDASPGTCDTAFKTGGQSVSVTVIDSDHFSYTSPNSSGTTTNQSCLVSKAGIVWSAQTQLDRKVLNAINSGTDPEIQSRFIYTLDDSQAHPLNVTGPNGLKEFRYSTLTPAEQGYFDNQCLSLGGTVILSQCTGGFLSLIQIAAANLGSNLVPYLRGQNAMETTTPNPVYRPRQHFLGDIVDSKPDYVRAPLRNYADSQPNDLTNPFSYATFSANNQTREATLYVAANDGMLHAFDAGSCPATAGATCNPGTGNEVWAYVPRMIMPKLHQLADVNYSTKHIYLTDGSPESMDIFVDSAHALSSGLSKGWHTLLVAGLNGGGRGYYALDTTNPAVPIGLWETCGHTDSAGNHMCANFDADMGYSYGNPVITKRSSDGTWVVLVTSGYNNVDLGDGLGAGDGQGYLYVLDALSGAILQKIPTGSGSTASPSGLAKISSLVESPDVNNISRFVYGGDLNGDVWRFDLGAVGSTPTAYPTLSPTATRFATLYSDAAGTQPQPITTRPTLGDVSTLPGTIHSLTATGKPVVFIGTGKYVFQGDACFVNNQSIYALEDDLSATGATEYLGNPRARSDMVQQTVDTATGNATTNPVNWYVNGGSNEGWYMDLATTGERVNIDPQLVLGTLFVVSNIPICSGSAACVNGGTSYLYQFDYKNGQGVGGAVRSKIGDFLTVGFEVVRLESGDLRVLDKGSGGQNVNLKGNVSGTSASRSVSWRELVQ